MRGVLLCLVVLALTAPPPSRTEPGSFQLSSLLLLAPCALAGGLGVWQLQRREAKLGQLAERQEQLAAQPLSLRALARDQGVAPWRRVAGRGELRHKDAAFVRARPLRVSEATTHSVPLTRPPPAVPPHTYTQVGPRVRTIGGTARKGYLLVRVLVWRAHTLAHHTSRLRLTHCVLPRWNRSFRMTAALRCW